MRSAYRLSTLESFEDEQVVDVESSLVESSLVDSVESYESEDSDDSESLSDT